MGSPTSVHYALLWVLCYLRDIASRSFFYSSQFSLQLQAYSDAMWASDSDDRHSITGYCLFLGSSLVVWKTKKQTTIVRSNVEAEIHALSATI